MGWDWVGRLRGRTQVKPQDVPDDAVQWIDSRRLHALASNRARALPPMQANRSDPIAVWCSMPRHARDVSNAVSRASSSLKAAAREREPWLIVASPQLHAPQLVNLYARRMQIELAFRDLKSHRYGQAMEDSLTRRGERLQILLLLNTLATFASWLAWDAKPPVSPSGYLHAAAHANSTRRCASAARRWSGAGRWNQSHAG
ncbi:transposase [Xanthomonas oryzae]|uniref:transposase n=1 Tax=Xanthomonas oryzae TaxID=347 RepID=UPI00338D6500